MAISLLNISTFADDEPDSWPGSNDIQFVTETEPEPEQETEPETELETESETEPETAPKTESETEPETEPEKPPKDKWVLESGSWYYYIDNSEVTGWKEIDDSWYYFGSDGAMLTGWVNSDSSWYYLGSSGAMLTGWQKIDGKWYCFGESGAMLTGWQKIDGKWYYMKKSGSMATGWIKPKNTWYYLKTSGAMATGWNWIDGKWYLFSKSGSWIDRPVRIAICGTYGSESYQADDALWEILESMGASVSKVSSSVNPDNYDGLLIPGGIDIDPYLYGESNYACGHIDRSFDWEQYAIIDKFVKSGKAVLGVCRGCELINVYFGGSLYQDISGHKSDHRVYSKSGSLLNSVCGSGFYVNSTHHQAIKALGWNLISTQWASDGVIEAVEHESLPVYGVLWHPENSGSKGSKLLSDFAFSMCRHSATGWHKIKNKWYYFDSTGTIVTGWHIIDGKEYYFKSSGEMASSEWVKGFWWLSSDGEWKYQYQGAWQHDSKGWWFGDSSGWKASNERITIDGKSYEFNSEGYWIE